MPALPLRFTAWPIVFSLAAPGAGAAGHAFGNWQVGATGGIDASYGTHDDGAFNYAPNGYETQRLFRLHLTGELRRAERVALLAQLRSDNLHRPIVRALYLRVRLLTAPELDLQIGRLPPLVGGFGRRYGEASDPLIGIPLPYQYATTLHHDRLPYGADALLSQRGYGAAYAEGSYGDAYGATGLPLVDGASAWDTGVQLRVAPGAFEFAVGLTRGSPSYPVYHDDNDRLGWSGRVQWHHGPGVTLGLSGAHSPYVSEEVAGRNPAYPFADQYQDVLTADIAWAAGATLLRGEVLLSSWDAPTAAPDEPLRAVGVVLEGRRTLLPGLHVAARVEHLDFDSLRGTAMTDTWDAPVWRVEAGLGYALARNARLKLAYQFNWRDAGPERSGGVLALGAALGF